MYKCALRGFHPLALPLVGVVVRPAALRRFNLAGGSVPPQAFPLLPVWGVGAAYPGMSCRLGIVLALTRGALCSPYPPRDIRQRAIVGGSSWRC